MKKIILLLLFLTSSWLNAQSVFSTSGGANKQTSSVPTGSASTLLSACDVSNAAGGNTSGASNAFGQSFTATCTGSLTAVDFYFDSPSGSFTMNIYLGETLVGTSLGTATLASGITGTNTFTFATPIYLTSGQQYSIIIASTSGYNVQYSFSNPYSGGNATDGVTFYPSIDLVFTAYITACTPPSSPTVSPVSQTICSGNTITPINLINAVGITNGDFETGSFAPWTIVASSPTPVINGASPHGGTNAVALGSYGGGETPGDASFYQTMTVSSGGGTLSFWYKPTTTDSISYDWQDAYITNTSGGILATIMHVCSGSNTWTQVNYNMAAFAGQTVRVMFLVHGDNAGDPTNMYVDDVSLTPLVTYSWTRDNTATVTGIAASGTGNITGSLTNTTAAPITVTFSVIATVNSCPSNPTIVTVLVNPNTSNTTTASACDSYTWSVNGTTYTTSGMYTVVNGCDTQNLDLTITPSTSNTTTVSACDTYTWSLNGTTYTTSGMYTVVNGCDTQNLDLTINTTPQPTPQSTDINVTMTGGCSSLNGLYNETGMLNGKKKFSYSVIPSYQIGFDGVKWVLYAGALTNNGFESLNVPAGLYPPTTGWTNTQCPSGTLDIVLPTSYTFCDGATVADLTANGTNLQWYNVPTNGAALATTTTLVSGTYYVSQTINSCESTRFAVTVTVNPLTSNTTTASACDTYIWSANGTTYTASGMYTYVNGCDTEMLDLTITPGTSSTTTVSACDTYTWSLNGTTYTASGMYTVVNGCDTQNLDLTINTTPQPTIQTTDINVTMTGGCSFLNGLYNENGMLNGKKNFIYSLNSGFQIGFDGVKWVLYAGALSNTGFENTTVPAGLYPPTSGWYNTQCGVGTLIIVTPNTFCDGATVADLTANGTNLQWYNVPTNGAALATTTTLVSGTYYVSQTISGCESTRLAVTVTITPLTSNTTTASACDSYTWSVNGTTYTTSGMYTVVNGCDTQNLDLTITPSTSNTTTASACDSYTWSVNGTTYTTSGMYTVVNGCDTQMLDLTINVAAPVTITSSDGVNLDCNISSTALSAPGNTVWTQNGAFFGTANPILVTNFTDGSVIYGVTSTDANGCTATATIVINMAQPTSSTISASACDSYTWAVNGTTYTTSGMYSYVNGCDTQNLDLTITPSTSNTTTASACDSYFWSVNEQTYSASGTYTYVNGCDTEMLDLTITPSTSNTTTVSACDSYTWSVNGTTYTTSGMYTVVNGCDTQMLDLTINVAAPVTITSSDGVNLDCNISSTALSAPGNTVWTQNGAFFGTANPILVTNFTDGPVIYGVTSTDANGCTATATIVINMAQPTSSTVSASACNSYTWAVNGTTYATSGMYSYVNGCDTQNLDLTITPSTSNTTTASACDTYTWSVNGTTYTTSGVYTFVNGCDTQNLDLTINTTLTPAFTAVAPICSGTTIAALPTTSNNGISGLWSPALVNTATTTYTFTPNGGQCATTATMTIIVNPNPVIGFSANPFPICAGGSTVLTANVNASPTLSYVNSSSVSQNVNMNPANFGTPVTSPLSGILVNVSSNACTPLVAGSLTGKIALIQRGGCTFATKAQNAQNAGAIGVVLYNNVAGAVTPGGTAAGVTIPVYGITQANGLALISSMTAGQLPITLSPSPTFSYLWTNGDTTNSTNTGALNVDTIYTVTVTNTATGCSTLKSVNVPVTPNVIPTFTAVTPICSGGSLSALPTTSNNGIAGSWQPVLDNTATTTYTFTPTPVAGQCLGTTTLTIIVNPNTTNTTTASACDSYTWSVNGTTYTTSGMYTVVNGCDTQMLDLTITPSTSNTTTASACDSYTWSVNGTTYTTSGIFTVVNGCDTQMLDLTITPSTSNTTTASACDSYTWSVNGTTYTTSGIFTVVNGCDTQMLDLTITTSTSNTTTVSACGSYTWSVNGTTYSTSGMYSFVNGCNTQNLDLTINSATATPTGNATQTLLDTDTIASIVVNPTTVIWYPTQNDAIAGTNALPNTTIVTANTYYAVDASGLCPSLPFAVTIIVTLKNTDFDTLNFSYYPNPTSGILNIDFSREISQVTVTNMLGQTIMDKKTNSENVQVDLSSFADATYFVKVVSEGKEKTVKVIKK